MTDLRNLLIICKLIFLPLVDSDSYRKTKQFACENKGKFGDFAANFSRPTSLICLSPRRRRGLLSFSLYSQNFWVATRNDFIAFHRTKVIRSFQLKGEISYSNFIRHFELNLTLYMLVIIFRN